MIAGMGSPGTPDPARRGPGRAPLRRRASRRLIAGVAGGLADFAGVRAGWFRLGFAVAALAGGVGVLLYALLWWLIPREDLLDSAAQRFARRFPDAPSWVGIGLLLAGGVFLADEFGLWRANVVLGFALIGLGVALFRRDLEAARPATPGAGADARSAAPPTRAAPEPGAGSTPPTVGGPADDASIRPIGSADATPRSRREPSPLGWLTVGTALLAVSTAGMLANLGLVRLPLVVYPAAALLVVGAGLTVGAFVGRARWLALPGLLLVPVVLAASLVRVPLEGGMADLVAVARTPEEAGGTYRRAVGSIALDLCRIRERATVPIVASTALGDLTVVVPREAEVRVVAEVGYGRISIGPRSREGFSLHAAHVLPAQGSAAGPTFLLDLRTGFGSVWVRRPPPTARHLREEGAPRGCG